MDITVFLVVMAAAILHATWNALIKSSGDRFISMAFQDLVMLGISLTLIVFVAPTPNAEAFPYIFVSAGVLVFYRIFLLKAYQHGDFSRAYPIARGVSPLLVGCAGFAIGDDVLSSNGYGAISLISLGIISLVFSKKYAGDKKLDRGLLYALATGCMIATYSVIDSRGVRIAETAIGYNAYLTSLSTSWLPIYALITRRRALIPAFRLYFPRALISGSCSVAAYLCVVWAFSQASPVQVVALRETSVIFGAVIGAYILKEGFGPRRIFSAALVVAGIVLLHTVN